MSIPTAGAAVGSTGTPSELLEEVRMVDELPFRAFCTTEQHGVDDGYLPSQLTLIAGLGTVTSRVRFRTNALLLPLYSWRGVVEEGIVADLLSGGRLDLGVAVGNYAREFELFGADITKRGELMEAALPFIRMGLTEGVLPDGPGGSPVPVLPRPAQARMPIYMGGLADRVIDRAVRLTDGVLPVDFMEPEKAFPEFWETKLRPALERHDRTLDDFRFIVCTHLWASEDPERDWEGFYRSARDYQLRKYAEWRSGSEAGLPELEALASPDSLLVDTPENLAKRLLALRTQIPFDELVFWYRIPGSRTSGRSNTLARGPACDSAAPGSPARRHARGERSRLIGMRVLRPADGAYERRADGYQFAKEPNWSTRRDRAAAAAPRLAAPDIHWSRALRLPSSRHVSATRESTSSLR